MPGKVSRTSLLGRERNKAGRGTKRSKCDTLGKVWLSTWPGTVSTSQTRSALLELLYPALYSTFAQAEGQSVGMQAPGNSDGTGPFSEETRTWVKAHGNWGAVRLRCSIHWAAVDKGLQLTRNPVQEACQPRASPGCSIYRSESRGIEKLRYLFQLIYNRKMLSSYMSLPSVSCYFLPCPDHATQDMEIRLVS